MNFDTCLRPKRWVTADENTVFTEGEEVRITKGGKTFQGTYRPGIARTNNGKRPHFLTLGIIGLGLLPFRVDALVSEGAVVTVYRAEPLVSDQIKALPSGSIVRDNEDRHYLIKATADGPVFIDVRNGKIRRDWWSWDRDVPQGTWAVPYMGGTA